MKIASAPEHRAAGRILAIASGKGGVGKTTVAITMARSFSLMGERVLLVEDLTTDGGSKLSFVDAIRETGATCGHTAVIFYYGIFPETIKTLGDHGVELHHLCTWWEVLEAAKDMGNFNQQTLDQVEAFLKAPREWQEANAF